MAFHDSIKSNTRNSHKGEIERIRHETHGRSRSRQRNIVALENLTVRVPEILSLVPHFIDLNKKSWRYLNSYAIVFGFLMVQQKFYAQEFTLSDRCATLRAD